jgi:hypothetical protein
MKREEIVAEVARIIDPTRARQSVCKNRLCPCHKKQRALTATAADIVALCFARAAEFCENDATEVTDADKADWALHNAAAGLREIAEAHPHGHPPAAHSTQPMANSTPQQSPASDAARSEGA